MTEMEMRHRRFLRKCPCGCGRNEYNLGEHRGFALYQKPFYNGWYIYAEKLHPDMLDRALLLNETFPNRLFDDTERLAHPSLEEVEKNVLKMVDDFWQKKEKILNEQGLLKRVRLVLAKIEPSDHQVAEPSFFSLTLTKQQKEDLEKAFGILDQAEIQGLE